MSEEIKKECVNDCEKKRCFIITPIGNDATPIRRHIDGLIDECIIPVLEKNYITEVAHRITTPGSINNQVIERIYEADLVIANLTELNANVMYELAFRHAIRKPVILIMEKSDKKLPFDVTTERTIFYDNDFQGAIDLKNGLKNVVESIQGLEESTIDNPIYSALAKKNIKEIVIKEIDNTGDGKIEPFQYILNRLDNIESKFNSVTMNIHSNRDFKMNENFKDEYLSMIEYDAFDRCKIYLDLNDDVVDIEKAKLALESITSTRAAFQSIEKIKYSENGTAVLTAKAKGEQLKDLLLNLKKIEGWRVHMVLN